MLNDSVINMFVLVLVYPSSSRQIYNQVTSLFFFQSLSLKKTDLSVWVRNVSRKHKHDQLSATKPSTIVIRYITVPA